MENYVKVSKEVMAKSLSAVFDDEVLKSEKPVDPEVCGCQQFPL